MRFVAYYVINSVALACSSMRIANATLTFRNARTDEAGEAWAVHLIGFRNVGTAIRFRLGIPS